MLGSVQDWKLRFRQEEQAKAQPVVQGVEPALGFRPLARTPKGSEWVSSQLHTGGEVVGVAWNGRGGRIYTTGSGSCYKSELVVKR